MLSRVTNDRTEINWRDFRRKSPSRHKKNRKKPDKELEKTLSSRN